MEPRWSIWLTLVDEVGVPAELSAAVRHSPAALGEDLVAPALLPDQGHTAAQSWDLRRLGVSLDLAVAEVHTESLLLLWG
jgi:branched-subunit amino acid transport protein